jgi:acetyl/propionyl-CoA carboxylase alpha subunit
MDKWVMPASHKPTPIKTLFIANRGEIVCRIVATCRAMGIRTVTVYAADDSKLPHASIGDQGMLLEGKTLAETYLNADQLIAVAKQAGADAIHPGYGFLSENAAFADKVVKAGLVFVGPPAEIIAKMGDKAASRKLCVEIGVPVIPGYHGDNQDDAQLAKEAQKIGFPVLIKAAAGGGGKGMRVVERAEDVLAGIASARSEAENAFGNGHLLIEKYLVKPRHIEVQVFSDSHGNHLHLFDRDCSIQRRHQKIVEESPAPNLPDKTRHALYDAAIKITRHIGYVGAGTMEFILDASGAFYFLEMNTRLQVEHPVTEMVTGLDLVRMQIEAAEGHMLTGKQEDIISSGHAVEVRLYAEDPAKGFLPAPGHLTHFSLPHLPGVRCENGYRSGTEVSQRYDPMIAKIAAHAPTRAEAIAKVMDALSQTLVGGVTTNRTFLMQLLGAEDFCSGKVSTDFIDSHKAELFDGVPANADTVKLIAAYLLFGSKSGGVQAASGAGAEHSAWTNDKLAGFR